MKAIFDNGLDDEQVKQQRQKFGENDIYTKLVEKSSSKISFWKVFISEVREPMILMLFVVGILYFIWDSLWNAIVVFSCIILMVLVEVGNEYRSKRGVMELKSSYFMSKTCTVRRNGILSNISVSDLVPGDVINFNGGQILPADVRLYNYENRQISVQVDESILTGESMVCNKHGNNISSNEDMSKCENILLTGTSIKKGKGFGIVVNVGCENTGLGNILKLLGKSMEKDKKTELQKTMKELAKYLTIISIVMASIIVISLLIKKLHVPESLANITHIITDKTGTITKNCLQLIQVNQVDKDGNVDLVYDTKKQMEKNNWIIEWLLSGYTEVGADLADPFEKSVSEELERCSNQSWKGFLKNRTENSYSIVDEMPFDHTKGFATLILSSGESKFVTHKGIPERMITNCLFYQVSNESEQVPMTEEVRERILSFLEVETTKGMRVICLCKDNEQSQMVFVSLLSFTDPLRSGVKEAISDCKNAGIKVIIVSGDHTNTVISAARECGLLSSVKQDLLVEEHEHSEDEDIELEASLLSNRQSVCIEGKDVNDKMDVDSVCAISRATPQNKYDLVEMLKEQKGYKVLVSGDGMNDVPAISNATVGIAMRSGVDLAKEAAEIIIMDDNFATIVAGIREGRRLYANLRKSLQFYLSCKVTLVVLFVTNMIVGGSSAIPFIPLEPMQIILLELFSDIGAATTFVLEEEEETLMKNPPRTEKNFVDKSFIYHIIIGSISLFATVFSSYMLGVFVLSPMYGLEGSSHQEYAQNWFGMHGIVLYPFVLFALPKDCLYKELIQHELIHARQIKREGFFSFYFSYAKELMMNIGRELLKAFAKQEPKKRKSSRSTAVSIESSGGGFSLGKMMRNISYEDEAYGLEHVSLYDEEKKYLKDRFDIDMDDLMTEEEYNSGDVYSSCDE
ncbi:predicted protein [Naegleria gruberi]|uniref:Predicted protein n=1 Tax=Naegleria gruberi TaxID=5762 RepID=D2W2A3_NAEGR|nr:uncharacterized protein NAEGRDRAFT_54145 [Naegleria gruberi]EFC36789.1 predicted protein [Naegleria gruberi]|eukprot:XP_002669533.1 predicted protein [Naegleria gruberi strain NEG-M]